MIVTSLEVENWRGLRHIHLAELAPDLTLVTGPNESGKSSLVEALRFALFEPSAGKAVHKRAVQAWGSARGAPTVRVGLETPEGRWSIEKQFLDRPSTTLVGPGGTFRDDEAEARILAMFSARSSKARQVRPEEMGLGALLFVPQGASRRATHEDLNDDARAALHTRLSALVGEMAAGPVGERVLRLAREEARAYWGGAGGTKPVDRLARAIAGREEAARRLEEAARRRHEVHAWAEQLSGIDEALSAAAPELARIEEQGRVAAAKAEEVRALDLSLATAAARRESAARAEQRAADTVLDVDRLEGRLAELQAAVTTADEAHQRSADAATRAATIVAEAERRVDEATAMERQAKQAVDDRRRSNDLRRHAAELEALRRRLEEAEEVEARIAALAAQLAANTADAATISRVREEAGAVDRARAALDGAAARVRVSATVPVRFDTPGVGGTDTEILVTAPTRLHIGDVATVSIEPGGRAVHALRQEREAAEARLAAVLRACGARDLADAERLAGQRAEWGRERAAEERALQAMAGNGGTSALRARETQLRVELRRMEELGPQPDAAGAAPRSTATAGSEADGSATARSDTEVEAAAAQAELSLRAARGDLDAATNARATVDRALAAAGARRAELHGQHLAISEARARLGAAEVLRASATRALEDLRIASAEVAAVERLRESLGGAAAADDAERLGRASANLRAEQEARRADRARIRTALEVSGAGGLHEEVQAAEVALDEATRLLTATQARAAAARRLADVLERARGAAQERLLGPVTERLAPYVSELFPGRAPMVAGHDWTLLGLTGDHEELYPDLSGGAQEQLALLVRVAMVEVLAGGARLPLVLDDSLINTDEARQARLLSILYRASRKLQVIIFTCHPERFAGLGQSRRYDLPALRA